MASKSDLSVAVGEDGVIATTPDGKAWTARSSGVSKDLNAVATNGSRFVGVGEGGLVIVSDDGLTWREVPSGGSATLEAVAYLQGAFYAVGPSSPILRSTDGESWQQVGHASPGASSLAGSESLLLAPRTQRTGVWSSPDGVTWTLAGDDGPAVQCAVTFGTGSFLIADLSSGLRLSTDGRTWQGVQVPGWDGDGTFKKCTLAYGAGTFVLTSWNGLLFVSGDGQSWTQLDYGDVTSLRGIAFIGNQVVIAGWLGRVVSMECSGGVCTQPKRIEIAIADLRQKPTTTAPPAPGPTKPTTRPASCLTANDCPGKEICVSGRACSYGSVSQTCSCGGTTKGQCMDYGATNVRNPNTCVLTGGACGMGEGLAEQNTLCCQGLTCTNARCEGPSGRCP